MRNKLILEENTKFEEAIELLDKNGNGVLPVVDKRGELLGIITDGDIRKAILNKQLDLKHIINKNPYKLNINLTQKQKIQYLKTIRRRHLPLVDANNKFVEMFTLDDVDFKINSNWVVIMAGGLGSRLGELTKDTPKPMLEVGNRPMLEHIIELFVSHGFTKFILSVNYKAEVIKDYFKDGSSFGVEIKYIEEKKRLGTAGALSLIDFEINEPFFVTNGDVMTTLDFEKLLKFHISENADATMCTIRDSYQIPYGVIEIDNKNNITQIMEKPKYDFFINTGIYILNSNSLKYIPHDEYFDMPSLFTILNDENKSVKSYEISDYWIDIGKKEDYIRINDDFK